MRLALALVALAILAPVARADDAADVKQAYITYLQARLDRDLDAAKAASVGDELAQRSLASDVERQVLTDKMQAAQAKFSNTTRPARPKMDAAQTFKMMLDNAEITTEGDTATIKPKNAPPGALGYGFRKVDGKWKADLNKWERPVRKEQVEMLEHVLPLMREVHAKIDSGEITTMAELEAAMRSAEQAARAKAGPTTRP